MYFSSRRPAEAAEMPQDPREQDEAFRRLVVVRRTRRRLRIGVHVSAVPDDVQRQRRWRLQHGRRRSGSTEAGRHAHPRVRRRPELVRGRQ